MKTTLLFSVILILTTPLFAQIDSIDLDQYKQPEFLRQTLVLNFDMGNVYHSDNYDKTNSNFNLNLAHSAIDFDRTKQRWWSNSVNFNYYRINRNEEISSSTSHRLYSNLIYRKFSSNERYLELGYSLSLNYSDHYRITASVPLRLGKGRIELVNDAWHLNAIVNQLNKNGILGNLPNQKVLFEFANKLGQIKNKRVLDFRFENIFEIEQVTTLFKEIGYEMTPAFFAQFIDAYRYESFINRYAGSSFSFGLTPFLDYNNNTGDYRYYSLFADIKYEYFKPIKVKYQLDYSMSLGIGIGDDNVGAIPLNPTFLNNGEFALRMDATIVWGYFPNSRINFRIGSDISNFYNIDLKENTFSLYGRTEFNYFFAPQFKMQIMASLGILDTQHFTFSNNRNNHNLSISGEYLFR